MVLSPANRVEHSKRSFNDLRGVGFSLLKGCLPSGGWPFCFASGKECATFRFFTQSRKGRKGERKVFFDAEAFVVDARCE